MLKSPKDLKALSAALLPIESCDLAVVPLDEVAAMLRDGLAQQFADVDVQVVQCPDLTKPPFNLAMKGLCGETRLLDVGGVPYLIPSARMDKLYDLKEFPHAVSFGGDSALMIGAGAAPWTFLKRNAEMMVNMSLSSCGEVLNQRTYISRTFDHDDSYSLMKLPDTETKMSLLANLFLCRGEPGEVLQVRVGRRTGPDNLVSCMRKSLGRLHAGSIGLGGVFCALQGQLKIHIMPEYSAQPLHTDADVNSWLRFYSMKAPFTMYSVLISRDPGLDLRVEHSHGVNIAMGQGGHYHEDTTPDAVQYLGYFNLAERCYRLDRPLQTHSVGRD